MPRIIYRYLSLEILPPFAVSLLAFTSIVFLGRMMRVTQMIVVKGVGLAEVLKSCVYLLPYLLVFTLPMAATVGILLALMRLTVDQEIIALKTAGLSYAQLVPPVLAFAIAAACLTAGLTLSASSWGQRATKELLMEVVKKRADLGIKEQTFNTDFSGLMLFVNHIPPKSGRLEGIFVYDSREEANANTIYAQKGEMSFDKEQEALVLHLSDGWVFHWGEGLNRWQTVEFKSYELPMRLFTEALKGGKSEGEMSLEELWQGLQANPDPERYNRLMVELSQRFAMPFGAFLLCLMAMPLGMSPRHHGRTWGLILGLMIFLIYYVVFTASWRLAVNARVNPALAPWTANLLFVVLALYLWFRTVRELPLIPLSRPAWWRRPAWPFRRGAHSLADLIKKRKDPA
jgi:lipopolysaccharide export system permease protein